VKRSVTIRPMRVVLKAAMSKAGHDGLTLSDYIEGLLRRDLKLEPSDSTFERIEACRTPRGRSAPDSFLERP